MRKQFFNTAFSLSMVQLPANMQAVEISAEKAAKWLKENEVENVANPSHANTLDAVSKKLGVNVRGAKGGRVLLSEGDACLVAQVTFPTSVPRETKEYSDEQVASGTFLFIMLTISG